MCCLFGMIDYHGSFTGRQKTRLLSILAAECESRGTDASGVACCAGGSLRVYKRPVPAHVLRLRIPDHVPVVLGHTRMTTQGSQKKNFNSHPFLGNAGERRFALAHNGVLYNDQLLRRSLNLPPTKIETDSYIAVQLIEQQKTLDFSSLKYMAEQVEDSFTFTLLDEANNWYLVKGDNPLCLYHFPRLGVYLYASTEEILCRALRTQHLGRPKKIQVDCGDILKISPDGVIHRSTFEMDFGNWMPLLYEPPVRRSHSPGALEREYRRQLEALARWYGYDSMCVDDLLNRGFTLDDVAQFLYEGN